MGYVPAVQVKFTVTLLVFHPAELGVGEVVALIVGSTTACMFTVTLVEAELPALSVTVPMTGVEPTVVTVTGVGHVATPDKASVQVNVTVALP
jgi:hypothetical protein